MKSLILMFLSLLIGIHVWGSATENKKLGNLIKIDSLFEREKTEIKTLGMELIDKKDYSILYVVPIETENGNQETEFINGVKRLKFRELNDVELKQFAPLIRYIETSVVISKALELRTRAREYAALFNGGRLLVEDAPDDPYYIILKASENSLEVKADKAIVYKTKGPAAFSEVMLLVSGLGPVPFEKFIQIPFLAETIVAHELIHCVQAESIGSEQFLKTALTSSSMNALSHKVHVLTDPTRAFIEGFAIGFEKIGGHLFNVDFQKIYDDFVANGSKDFTPEEFEFLKEMVMPEELRRQLWLNNGVFAPLTTIHRTDSIFEYPRDILNSEGIVGSTIYNLLINSKIKFVYAKTIATLIKGKPSTLEDFVQQFGKEFPDNKNEISTLFVKQTMGVTRNADLYPLFKTYLKIKSEENSDVASIDKAKNNYEKSLITELQLLPYDSVLNSLLNKPLLINTKHLGVHYPPFSINLNQDSRIVLKMILQDMVEHYETIGLHGMVDGFKNQIDAEVGQIVHRRESLSNLNSINDLAGFISDDLLSIFSKNQMN